MFDNIGRKIKTIAKIGCWIGVAASVILGPALMGSNEGMAFVIMVIGSLSSWIGSWSLYGFGELIEKTTEIAENTRCSNTANEPVSENQDDITK